MTEKTKEQIFKELVDILGRHISLKSFFDNEVYFNYYSEITKYDLERLDQFGYVIKGLVPKIDETKFPYIQVRLAF